MSFQGREVGLSSVPRIDVRTLDCDSVPFWKDLIELKLFNSIGTCHRSQAKCSQQTYDTNSPNDAKLCFSAEAPPRAPIQRENNAEGMRRASSYQTLLTARGAGRRAEATLILKANNFKIRKLHNTTLLKCNASNGYSASINHTHFGVRLWTIRVDSYN